MLAENVDRASSLLARRRRWVEEYGYVKNGQYGITLSGAYQDQEFLAACALTVAGEIRRRITTIDDELILIGVEPPPFSA